MCFRKVEGVTVSFKTALGKEKKRMGQAELLFVFCLLILFCVHGHSLQPPSGPTEQKTVFITRRPLPLCPERKSGCVRVKLGYPCH